MSYEVEDEEAEGVWGYLVPLDAQSGDVLVLRKRSSCPKPPIKVGATHPVKPETYERQEQEYAQKKTECTPSGGYLIGRHPECGELMSMIHGCD